MASVSDVVAKEDLFDTLKTQLLNIDPIRFVEKYLTIDGKPFNLSDGSYKPFADIYRYIGIKALEPTSKPVMLVKGRQVGGTVMAAALEMYFMGSGLFGTNGKPPVRVYHLFPQIEHVANYSKTILNTMISASAPVGDPSNPGTKPKSYMQSLMDNSGGITESQGFKNFTNGNSLRIVSTGLTADRIRGGTCDVMFFDESQDITGEAMSNAVKILTKAQYGSRPGGVQVFFGTPKKKGSDYYRMWEASTQKYYHLGCSSCKKYFPLYTPGSDDWEKVWIHTFIVKCSNCGFEQNKNEAIKNGKWFGLKSDDDSSIIGFHINQLYMPGVSKEKIMAEKPGIHPTNTERAYQNEVLGEFYQGDSSPISPEEIREYCADVGRKMKARIIPGEEKMVVLGIDYGARADYENMASSNKSKQGQSYSTAVIMSVKGPSLFSIEFAMKFKRNDPESKKGIIDNLMRQYSVDLAIGDIGYSNDFSTILHNAYGDRYLVARAHSKITDPSKVKYNQDCLPKELIFERDFYIAEMIELMKKGQVRFPFGDYDKIAWLVNHCSSMDIKPSISKYGDPTLHYVKGGAPNDGFMAMLNAYLAYKFLITKGFTSLNPNLIGQNLGETKKILAINGFISRKF